MLDSSQSVVVFFFIPAWTRPMCFSTAESGRMNTRRLVNLKPWRANNRYKLHGHLWSGCQVDNNEDRNRLNVRAQRKEKHEQQHEHEQQSTGAPDNDSTPITKAESAENEAESRVSRRQTVFARKEKAGSDEVRAWHSLFSFDCTFSFSFIHIHTHSLSLLFHSFNSFKRKRLRGHFIYILKKRRNNIILQSTSCTAVMSA